MDQEELKDLVRRLGLPIDDTLKGWLKIGKGRRRVYVASGEKVTRVHLTGLEDLKHTAIRPMDKEEAARRHLGLVRGEVLVRDYPAEVVRDAITKALHLVKGSPADEPSVDVVTLRLSGPLLAGVRAARAQIQSTVIPGVEIDDDDAARVLLHEALEGRRKGKR